MVPKTREPEPTISPMDPRRSAEEDGDVLICRISPCKVGAAQLSEERGRGWTVAFQLLVVTQRKERAYHVP